MTQIVQQNIAVVSILNLKQEADDGVRREAFAEVGLRGRQIVRLITEEGVEEVPQVGVVRIVLLEGCDGNRVGDGLDDATSVRDGEDLVGAQPHRDSFASKDHGDSEDELRCQLLLPQIVVGLDEDGNELPIGMRPIDGLGAYPVLLVHPLLLEDDRRWPCLVRLAWILLDAISRTGPFVGARGGLRSSIRHAMRAVGLMIAVVVVVVVGGGNSIAWSVLRDDHGGHHQRIVHGIHHALLGHTGVNTG
mmetsp:Transcript_24103/g.67231  ORF Transcript_24103/g.67231 Transcript_24103/m.67231 type:complete len:248 (+) Transcript_24103:480-1223(+)